MMQDMSQTERLSPVARRAWKRLESDFPLWKAHLHTGDGELEFAIPAPAGSTAGHLVAFSQQNKLWVRFSPPHMYYLADDETEVVSLIQTPHRFRTKRQLWAYSGLALETRTSGEHRYVRGQLRRSKKQVSIRGLNKDHNHDLKGLFKAAATRASVQPGPFQDFYQRSLAKGIKPTMVRLTLARKIAAITLTLWKKGENFDAEKLKSQAA